MGQTAGEYPRILFVNDFPPDSLALADLVRQLLVGYPSDRLSWWHWRWSKTRGLTDLRVARDYRWWLPDRLVPGVRFNSAKCLILERFWTRLAGAHLRRVVRREKPDLVWVLLFGWPILVARHAGLGAAGPRLHVSLWDYPDTEAGKKILGARRCERIVDAIYQLVRRANTCDGISAAVLEEIATRAGRQDAIPVHSGFEPEQLQALESFTETGADDVIRLAYVGTIISHDAFAAFLSALDRTRTSLPKPVKLEFFGARGYSKREWFNPEWMHEHGVFSDRGLVESLRRCAWGIVVTDPEGADLRYSRFSFPNKIGTYLSAGVPVLGVSHRRSSLAEVMQGRRLGAFSDATQPQELEKFIRDTLLIERPRSFFRNDILECARTEFKITEIRARLWKAWGGH